MCYMRFLDRFVYGLWYLDDRLGMWLLDFQIRSAYHKIIKSQLKETKTGVHIFKDAYYWRV